MTLQQLGDEELLIKHLDRVILRTDFLETKAEILRRIPRWRDATVEKPEPFSGVLLGWNESRDTVTSGFWNPIHKRWHYDSEHWYGDDHQPDAWMPLPPAPTTTQTTDIKGD